MSDSNGTRSAQITVQAPGRFAYREDSSKAITFNGNQFAVQGASSFDDAIKESLLSHFPDSILLQIAAGGSLRRLGGHFRTDDGKSRNYAGPYMTLYAFSPTSRPGLAKGKALQQDLFFSFDEQTGLLAEVRSVTSTGPAQITVVQTQFSKWRDTQGQRFPGMIVRLENGKQIFSFESEQATVGPVVAAAGLEP